MFSLIGAGPGDPELITLKAVERLKNADVVFYDRLVNKELLRYCNKEADIIYVGKEPDKHSMEQEEIIEKMIASNIFFDNVVRLKGGDPLIFGRGSEEAMALHQAGIEFEIIPGITAGIGAGAYAGIPITHRNLVTKAVFITAHEDPKKLKKQNDWSEIAKLKNTTIIIYMGVGNAAEISSILIHEGMDADMPAAIIENGTTTSQRTFVTTLESVGETIKNNKVKPPAIFIIGETVSMKQELDWFEQKPLFGVTVAATRASDQIYSLCSELHELGADVIPFSVIGTEIIFPDDDLVEIMTGADYDWLLFTSENGVRYFMELLELNFMDSRVLGLYQVAAIGKGTAGKLKEYNIIPDFVPSEYTSVSFVKEFIKSEGRNKMKFLRIKGNFKNDYLTRKMREKGHLVDTLDVYKILKTRPEKKYINRLKEEGCNAVTFTSQSTVHNFFSILGKDEAKNVLKEAKAFAIGPVTAKALDEYGIGNYIVAKKHTIDGIIEEVKKYFLKEQS